MDWLSENAWAVWLGVAAFLGIAELVSLDLVLVMLAVGALGGAVTAAAGAPFVLQLLVAGVISIGMLALVRPNIVRRLHTGPELRVGPETLIGLQALTPTAISVHVPGRIKIGGEDWQAKPYDESMTIEAGTLVEVLAIRGATAYVHPLPSIES
ncbi:NfeD family protein [Nocardioides sp. MAH-18]|uniref:NfeD family protein n=1 Tax=Nocardioides agri TaxID=2682843 RepID=A0A6L6XZY9_9ACTN|nr:MULTISPECIES: NfeD family protein [unclassified Nocardioides]MBA2952824.1 NfeD family protein [Nocardioides sp. CGMCC 1.13656]MVQ51986.1 NfeD family protein [Nocardioides sp. MAH-18]